MRARKEVMLKHPEGTNPDGTDRFRYELTEQEVADGYALFVTGPISGTVALPSGSAYDVTEYAIPVKTEDVGPLHVAIHKAHHAAGRFLDLPVPALEDVSIGVAPAPAPPPPAST
jgi:hypothetical protein